MIVTRCSKLPLQLICPPSRIAPTVRIQGDLLPANKGTVVHLGIHAHIDQVLFDMREAAGLFGIFDEDAIDEVGSLIAGGKRLWDWTREWFPSPKTEQRYEAEFDGLTLTGTADLVSFLEHLSEIRLLDFKSGWIDSDFLDQMRGYAALIFANFPWCQTVRACVLKLRKKDREWIVITRAESEAWVKATTARLALTEEYNPGEHCGMCPRAHECEAKTASIRQTANAMSDGAKDFFDSLPLNPVERAAILIPLLGRIRMAAKNLDKAVELIKADVQAFGSHLHHDGKEMVLDWNTKKKILFGPSEPILREVLGERFAEAVTVGKTKVAELVKASVEDGKGKAVAEVMERIEAAGGMVESGFYKLIVRKRQLQMEDRSDESDNERADTPTIASGPGASYDEPAF